MKALPRYTAVATAIVVLLVAVAAPFLDAPGRRGLALAAFATLPLQVALFALIEGARQDSMRFMAFWGMGVLGRMAVVFVVGFAVGALDIIDIDPTVTILSTVGLLFIFLLLEPVFLSRGERATGYAR